VKDIPATSGLSQRSFPTSGAWGLLLVITLNTPLGRPASSANCPSARAVRGVSSAGLTTHVHPAASAAPAFLVIIAIGKFHYKPNKLHLIITRKKIITTLASGQTIIEHVISKITEKHYYMLLFAVYILHCQQNPLGLKKF
jgi:hypothetical protein